MTPTNAYTRAALGLAGRTLRTTFRNPALLMPPLIAPLIFFTIFGGGLGALGGAPGFRFPGGYTSFSFVFILLNGAAFAAVFAGLALAQDLETGFSRRLMVGVGRRSALLVGYGLTALVRIGLGLAVLFGAAIAVGVRVHGSPWNVVWLVAGHPGPGADGHVLRAGVRAACPAHGMDPRRGHLESDLVPSVLGAGIPGWRPDGRAPGRPGPGSPDPAARGVGGNRPAARREDGVTAMVRTLLRLSIGLALAMTGWALSLSVFLVFIGLPVFFVGLALMQSRSR